MQIKRTQHNVIVTKYLCQARESGRKDDKLKTVHVTTAKPRMIRQLTILANFFLRKRLYK